MKKKTKIFLGMGIAGFLLLSGVIFFLASSLRTLTIKGNTYYTKEEVKQLLIKDRLDGNALILYIRLKYGKKIQAPFIEEVDVDLHGLNNLTVRIFEKDIMGAFPYMGEYVCFDKDGIMVGSITEKRKDVPIIEGIAYKKAVFNKTLDTDYPEMFDVILNITQLIKKYKVPIQVIHFQRDLSVRLHSGEVKIFLGKRTHFDEQISNLPALLEKTKGMKGVLRMEEYSSINRRVIFEGDKKGRKK